MDTGKKYTNGIGEGGGKAALLDNSAEEGVAIIDELTPSLGAANFMFSFTFSI